jgi:hypothetical protein
MEKMFHTRNWRKTNAEILWHAGHTKGRLHTEGIGQGKETKNLNVVDMLTIQK